MATTITQPTLIFSHTTPVNHIISSTSSLSHSNAIKRPHNFTSSSLQYVKKSTSHEPCVKSAIVFAFSLNDIIKSHLPEKKFRSDKEKIEVHFTQKLIGKIQLNFSELVLTLIYCNRYLKYCRKYKLPMPGSPGSVFPSMTHMVIPCLILAEVYLVDCPHNSVWWANKCSGGVTVENINRWKRDVLVTMKYWLYVEPTRDFVNWTRQIKKLAFALFGQSSLKHSLSNGSNSDNSNKPKNKSPTLKTISSSEKKVVKPSSSSSFHNSLQNHLNTISSSGGLYNHTSNTTNNDFSIRSLLSSKYSFNKTDSSILSNFCPSTLLNVINNNASAKMAGSTVNSSFIPNENHQENIIHNQEHSINTFGTKMAIANMTNNSFSSINTTTSTSNSNSSQNINQSPNANCSDNEFDDNTQATSIHHQSTIGRSRTIHNISRNSIINAYNNNTSSHKNVNTTTHTTKSESVVYPHFNSYIKSSLLTNLHYIGSNGQQIGSSLLNNLDYIHSNDSKVEQSFFRMSMGQKPSPLPMKYIANSTHTNYIPSSHSKVTSSSSTTATNQSNFPNNNKKVEDPFSNVDHSNSNTTKFHYPFHYSENDQNDQNNNINQFPILIQNQNQNKNQNNLHYPSNDNYTASTPGSSCSDTSNIHSSCTVTSASLISPKSFTSNISTSTSTYSSSVSTTDSNISSTESLNNSMMKSNINKNNYITNFQSGLNDINNSNNNNNDLFYLDYKKFNNLPSNFNPHSKFIKENSNISNSKIIEHSNSRSNDRYFKILVKTELDSSSNNVMEIEEERKLISPPHTPN